MRNTHADFEDDEVVKATTPCDIPDQDGVHRCPYSDDPTGETCRNYCGLGVDE